MLKCQNYARKTSKNGQKWPYFDFASNALAQNATPPGLSLAALKNFYHTPSAVAGGKAGTVDGGQWEGRYRRWWPFESSVLSTVADGEDGTGHGGNFLDFSFFLKFKN